MFVVEEIKGRLEGRFQGGMAGRNSFGSMPASESKSFLKKGDAKGVGIVMAGKPTNRTLQLKKPGGGPISDNDATSYTGIYARHSAPRPVSAPNTPQRTRQNHQQYHVRAGRDAAALLLMGMDEGVFTSKCGIMPLFFAPLLPIQGHPWCFPLCEVSISPLGVWFPHTAEHTLPSRHTAGGAQLRAAAIVRTTPSGSSPFKKLDNQRDAGMVVDSVVRVWPQPTHRGPSTLTRPCDCCPPAWRTSS